MVVHVAAEDIGRAARHSSHIERRRYTDHAPKRLCRYDNAGSDFDHFLRRVEEQHRFRRERAALGGAEGQHVDTRFPGRLRGRSIDAHQRVGKAGAVHVNGEAAPVHNLCEAPDFVWTIDRSGLGRLRQREHRRAHVMWAAPLPFGQLAR